MPRPNDKTDAKRRLSVVRASCERRASGARATACGRREGHVRAMRKPSAEQRANDPRATRERRKCGHRAALKRGASDRRPSGCPSFACVVPERACKKPPDHPNNPPSTSRGSRPPTSERLASGHTTIARYCVPMDSNPSPNKKWFRERGDKSPCPPVNRALPYRVKTPCPPSLPKARLAKVARAAPAQGGLARCPKGWAVRELTAA